MAAMALSTTEDYLDRLEANIQVQTILPIIIEDGTSNPSHR